MPATMECSNTSLDEDQTSLKKALSSFAERTNNPGTLGIPTTSQRRKRKATVQHTEQLAPIQRANECATDEPRGQLIYPQWDPYRNIELRHPPPYPGPPDPQENRMAPPTSMMDRYGIPALRPGTQRWAYLNSEERIKIVEADPRLGPLIWAFPVGCTTLDRASLQVIGHCMCIHSKVKILISRASRILQQVSHQRAGMATHEAAAVFDDALSSFSFWNASGHQVSGAAAERINGVLVEACLVDDVFSVTRNPDVVHFMVAGMFGNKTVPAAGNFRFLQELVNVSMIGQGDVDKINPADAYHIVTQRLGEFVSTLMNWCQAVRTEPMPNITTKQFTDLTYELYTIVYKDSHSYWRSLATHAPAMSSNRMTLNGGQKIAPLPPLQRKLPCPQPPSRQNTCSPLSVSSGTSDRSSNTPQSTHLLSLPTNLKPSSETTPNSTPNTSFLQIPNLPTPVLTKADPGTVADNRTGVCFSELAPPAIATRVRSAASFPVMQTIAQSSKVCHVTPTQLDTSLGDNVSLTRLAGKKIARYKQGHEGWLMLEDTLKTYLPRHEKKWSEIIRQLIKNHPALLCTLSPDARDAFRDFYSMAKTESFDLDFMISVSNLSHFLFLAEQMCGGIEKDIRF